MTAAAPTLDVPRLFAPGGAWAAAVDLPADLGERARGAASFVLREARLLDEQALEEWLALFSEDAVYWVPLVYGAESPGPQVNLIYDSRALLEDRVARLLTGQVPSQDPPSRTARVLGNLEVAAADAPRELLARATFTLVESRPRAQHLYAGHCLYRLRQSGGAFELRAKKVQLLDSDHPLPSLTFLP